LRPKLREHFAFTLPLPHKRCAFTFAKPRGQNAFTWRERSPLRSCRAVVPRLRDEGGFTLLELLLVIGIIILVAAFVAPAFTSLSKSSARKAAIGDLLGGIEQARTQAIKDGRASYVVFAAQPVGGASTISDKNILNRYFYHSFAIFEDDAADPVNNPKSQLTPWKPFPVGVSLRSAISFAPWSSATFAFPPAGAPQSFPYLKFNANGEVESPGLASGPVQLGIFEGFVTGTSETATNSANFTQTVTISPHTGRAEYIP
jgi:type II secretory pathway pseudopilin PulG